MYIYTFDIEWIYHVHCERSIFGIAHDSVDIFELSFWHPQAELYTQSR